ncbi:MULTISPECIES: FAD-binding protein [unclassified Exiguobacterium]|uniref:L-aspartate oxidase n=1 Tax=unclassified Exiguobacterium TaxID=2644629 RepID=UPI001BE9DB78|nr:MULTISPECIES: FAD-binding protein [unclassified Exiguobacterium]
MSLHKHFVTDVLIVGTGLAAITVALHLPDNLCALLVTKGTRSETNSMRAQGGIASSALEDDHEAHRADTVRAAKGWVNPEAVEFVTREGRTVISELEALGVIFDRQENGEYAVGREGAHGLPRIFHSGGDQTGCRMMETLSEKITHPVLEQTVITQLLTSGGRVVGAAGYRGEERIEISARAVVLATGGIGGLLSTSTNDTTITGDGLALAAAVGANLSDLGYVQHHPTILVHHGKSVGLITEALRGAGAYLMTRDGHRVMDNHPEGDLAARDEVAAMITAVRKQESVYLNTTPVVQLAERFPTFVQKCEKLNINPKLVEVTTGVHFLMGGIKTDLAGQTSVAGLYAVGETASIGLHGTNRLASNSLLECFVMGKAVARQLQLAPRRALPAFRPVFGCEDDVLQEKLSEVLTVELKEDRLQATLEQLMSESVQQTGRQAEQNRLHIMTGRLLLEGALRRLKEERQTNEQMAPAATT